MNTTPHQETASAPRKTPPSALRLLRVHRGETLDFLAAQLRDRGHKVDKGTLSRIETRMVEPSETLVAALADYYGRTPQQIRRAIKRSAANG